jgi:hypothetical protein
MLILPGLLGAGERDCCFFTVQPTAEAEVQGHTLRTIHEVGAGREANDDVGTNFGEGP